MNEFLVKSIALLLSVTAFLIAYAFEGFPKLTYEQETLSTILVILVYFLLKDFLALKLKNSRRGDKG